MARCAKKQTPHTFHAYFSENMEALGPPAPKSLYGTYTQAVASVTAMLATIQKLGAAATVAELIGATTGLEMLAVAGAVAAAYYIGAALGSLAVAYGRMRACGATIRDGVEAMNWAIQEARRQGIFKPEVREFFNRFGIWLRTHLLTHPEIIDGNKLGRERYAVRALRPSLQSLALA